MRPLVALALVPVLVLLGLWEERRSRGRLSWPRLVLSKILRRRQTPTGVALTWSQPTQYVDGTALKIW